MTAVATLPGSSCSLELHVGGYEAEVGSRYTEWLTGSIVFNAGATCIQIKGGLEPENITEFLESLGQLESGASAEFGTMERWCAFSIAPSDDGYLVEALANNRYAPCVYGFRAKFVLLPDEVLQVIDEFRALADAYPRRVERA